MQKKYSKLDPLTFNINYLDILEFKNNKYQSQISTLIYDDYERPIINTPWMHYNVHGIPKFSGVYHSSENNSDTRDHIKIPLDYKRVPKIKLLRDMLIQIDEKFGSNEFQTSKFDDEINYKYQLIVKKKVTYYKQIKKYYSDTVRYIKGKLYYTYNDNEKILATKLYHRINKQNVLIPIQNIVDIEKNIPWNSKIKYDLMMSKVWLNNCNNYGVKIIILAIYVNLSDDDEIEEKYFKHIIITI
jgi:hypothetical protein